MTGPGLIDRSNREKEKEVSGFNIDEDEDDISLPHSMYGDRGGTIAQRGGPRTTNGAISPNMTGPSPKGTLGATEGNILSSDDRDGPIGKPLVPTRLTVKKASTRAQQEAKRKADLAVRSKRLVRLSVCESVCVRLSVCPSLYLSICVSVCLFVRLSV